MSFFFFKRLGHMHENKIYLFLFCNFFAMFWQKPGILIQHLYLYGIKIQTNIKQNAITKYAEKSQFFFKIFVWKILKLGLTRPKNNSGPNPTVAWIVAVNYNSCRLFMHEQKAWINSRLLFTQWTTGKMKKKKKKKGRGQWWLVVDQWLC